MSSILLAINPRQSEQEETALEERNQVVHHLVARNRNKESEMQQRRLWTFSTVVAVDMTLSSTQRAVSEATKAIREERETAAAGKAGSAQGEGLPETTLLEMDRFDSVDSLVQAVQAQARMLSGRAREEFLGEWSADAAVAADVASLRSELESALEEVKKCSAEWIASLKEAPQSVVGVRMLQLFVQDLMGRSTREANIFLNQLTVNQIEERPVAAWGIKCLAFSFLVCLNCYFIFACMLYGKNKGKT